MTTSPSPRRHVRTGLPRPAEGSGGIAGADDRGMALALALGMREVARKPHRIAAGECELAVDGSSRL